MAEFDTAKLKDKIAKLLAKAEGTDNEHERDAFNAQAERMMLRLGIHRAELESAGTAKAEEIVEVHRDYTGNYSIVMIPFVHGLARAFGNLDMLQSVTRNGMLRRAYIIGHKSDVEEFLQLVDSLHMQVMAALKRWQKEHREERRYYTDMEKYTGNRSFIQGFGYTVATRLRDARKQEETVASPGAALVLVSKAERVQEWKNEKYSSLRPGRGGAKSYDSYAASAGASAGRSASLGEKGIGGSRAALS
jgi:hypothetical protein